MKAEAIEYQATPGREMAVILDDWCKYDVIAVAHLRNGHTITSNSWEYSKGNNLITFNADDGSPAFVNPDEIVAIHCEDKTFSLYGRHVF